MLHILLLIACICIALATVLYLFYWNRFIAWIIGLVIRVLYWNQGASSIWLEIGSIHFSILTGRILLKDIRYHSSNQTAKIVKGQIEWRYWIRRPMTEDEIRVPLLEGEKASTRPIPCRIQITFQGFEWFLYNRTAAYDNIISQMQQNNPNDDNHPPLSRRQTLQKSRDAESAIPLPPPSLLAGSLRLRTPLSVQRGIDWVRRQLPNFDPKDLLPLGILVTKGAIICGNASTPSLMVAEFKSTEGTFGIVPSRSKYDLHKQVLNLKFQHALVRFVQNDDYRNPATVIGDLVNTQVQEHPKLGALSSYLAYGAFTKLWRKLRLYGLTSSPDTRHWSRHLRPHKHGLVDDSPPSVDTATVEYAIERKILEAPTLELSYYADVAGKVPSLSQRTEYGGTESFDIGNGDVGPEWGIDLAIRRGFVRYGPWADRQRAELQKAFFPPTYQDTQETDRLRPGDTRVWTAMKVFVELRDDTTLHLPFREASKNWQWDGVTKDTPRPRKREAALIHVTAGDRSSINYIMPMVAGPQGYEPVLEVHLDTVAVTSSLNDIRLVSAESCRIRCDLPSPLRWNGDRTWLLAISVRQPVFYLIRDHINMFTDLGKDWVSGPPSDYHRFVPAIYMVELDMHHYEINLYANDHNIIDKPLIKEENALFSIHGARAKNTTTIPSNVFRPEKVSIAFDLEAADPSLYLSLPRWNTNALHLPKEGNSLAKLGLFRLGGTYLYFADVREDNVEQLKLTITARDLAYKLLGWSIRYFMVLRDNYLGSFTHFSTLYEYLEKRSNGHTLGDPVVQKYREGHANSLQVELAVHVERGTLVMPAGLPGYESTCTTTGGDHPDPGIGPSVVLTIPGIQVQFRLHDYYMELTANVDTISGRIRSDFPEQMTYIIPGIMQTNAGFLVDGIDITANRLFGPQPSTLTYVCIWEIFIGHVRGIFSATEGAILATAGKAFGLNFTDALNAPAKEYQPESDPDLTFLKLSVAALDVTWKAGPAAMLLSLPRGLTMDNNDLGGQFHKKLTSLQLPHACVKLLLTSPSEQNSWLEAAELTCDAYLDIYGSPAGWQELADAQADFVEEQDRLTGRARRMFGALRRRTSVATELPPRKTHRGGVYLPQPALSSHKQYRNINALSNSFRHPNGPAVPRKWSTWSHSSESGDDGLSEADRDARLARTREATPIPRPVNYEERNMSSGDESDDGDLTDADLSDSDWSELDSLNPEASQSTPSLLKLYGRFVRHYATRNLNRPADWNGLPFMVTRDRKAKWPSAGPSSERTYADRQHPGTTIHHNDRDTTSFRFVCRKGLEIALTPLVLQAISCLESDMETTTSSPELCVDSMMSGYMNGFPSSEPSEESSTFLDIQMAIIRIHLLQHTTTTRESHVDAGSQVSESLRLISNEVTLLDFSIENLFADGVLSGPQVALCGGFGELAVIAKTNVTPQDVPTYPPIGVVSTLALSGLQMTYARDSVDVLAANIKSTLSHTSPEHLTRVIFGLVDSSRQLFAVHERWNAYSSRIIPAAVHYVLESSIGQEAIDPLSAIQPSYLVQRGLPHELRTDPSFRFLFHLRNCLWYLQAKGSRHLLPSREAVTDDSLVRLLESRLMILDPDAPSVSHLLPLFPNLRRPHMRDMDRIKYTYNYVSLRVDQANFVLLEPDGGHPSVLRLSNTSCGARIRIVDFLEALPGYRSMSMSQASLRQKGGQPTRKVSVSFSLGDGMLTVHPHLMRFAQELLRVRRHHYSDAAETASSPKVEKGVITATSLDLIVSVNHLRAQAVAENLIFEIGTSNLRLASLIFLRHDFVQDQSMNHSLLFESCFIRARSPVDVSQQSDQDILASLVISDGKLSAVTSQGAPPSAIKVRSVCIVDNFHLHVPRSAIRLYRFIEEWRDDFLPTMETVTQAFLSELKKAPSKRIQPSSSSQALRTPTIELHVQVRSLGVFLQVMHGTWLSWEITSTLLHLNSSRGLANIGLQSSSQIFCVSSRTRSQTANATNEVRLELPPVSLSGSLHGSTVHAIALVEFIEVKVKPSHWDTLLAVQQKFGQDFNDLVALVQETRQRRVTTSVKKAANKQKSRKIDVFIKMRGFRIGLEGLSSTLYLECLDIDGRMNNTHAQSWSITLSDLALSLASRATTEPLAVAFNRNHRSAFVIIDFKVTGGSTSPEDPSSTQLLQISVTKIHAVMQPSSIGEVGDFVDYLQGEMLDRQEQRTLELAAFKQKTQSILKTFEVKIQDVESEEKPPWLNNYTIDISIRNIGFAFPLIHDRELELPQIGSRDDSAVRAFLFAIKSIKFSTQRGVTGQAAMKDFSFQFVSRFRQSVYNDFSGEGHQTRNRLVYPEMTAQLRSSGSATARKVSMKADVSGFILDLESTISDYVFSLVDVYRRGKDRVSQLTSTIPRSPSTLGSAAATLEKSTLLQNQHTSVPTSNLFASMTFRSGKVRMFNRSVMSRPRTFAHTHYDAPDEQMLEIGAELFHLPVVTVWAEYRATSASHKVGQEAKPSMLIFKSTVHSSQNTLRPTLLPFLTELVDHIETRLRKVSQQASRPPSLVALHSSPSSYMQNMHEPEAVSSMQMSFSLRIDQSKLELTCQPDVNVIAGLHWDSGGFVISVSPGARKVTLTGSVGGLTIGLKHGFLSEDCVKLDARNLAFSVSFSKLDPETTRSISSVSIVLDTEFLGGVRFSRLQDILCFKAVWLDRIPVFNGHSSLPKPNITATTDPATMPKQDFTTVILVRVRQIKLDVDLGQSISAISLDLESVMLRSKLTESIKELSLSVGDLDVTGKGNVGGHASVADFVFQTTRRTEDHVVDGVTKMLELRMTSGPLTVVLESDHQKLLHYFAEPLEIEIFDDWSMISPEVQQADRPLQLFFTVTSPEIVAVATVGTIPKLISYANKFKANLAAQREGASRESTTFRGTRSPKPDNPLSTVAEAMLHSARTRFSEAESGLSYIIRQHMSLRLDMLRLVVFPRSMGDPEIAQFIGRHVRARLDRVVESDMSPAKRDIHLSFSSMIISRFTQMGHGMPTTTELQEGKDWLYSVLRNASEANIVGLPSMTMHMVSQEAMVEQQRSLQYDFYSKFVRGHGVKYVEEDIYITLNVGLYSWLTLLRKAFSREMEQVRATADWRNNLNAPTSITTLRRKGPDQLNLLDPPRSASLPRPNTTTLSPFSARSASAANHTFALPSSHPSNLASRGSSEVPFPGPGTPNEENDGISTPAPGQPKRKPGGIVYCPRERHIERLTMRQLGEATPDVMHPFFMKKAGFSLEDSLPQYVNEYATVPLEEIMEVLLKLYSKQLLAGQSPVS